VKKGLLLAVDQGNTNTEFAVYQGDRLKGHWRTSTNVERTADEYVVWLSQLLRLEGLAIESIKAAIISSVVPPGLFDLKLLCRKHFDLEPLVIGDGVELGIKVLIDEPREAGADRLVNAVGGFIRYGGPLIIIDFGTATNFDIIDGEGNFCGGVLAPGISLALDAMHRVSARLPRVSVKRPPTVIGRNTVNSMQSGVYWGYVGLIEGTVMRIRAEYGEPMKVIATGGLGPLFEAATDAIEVYDPDVTVRGLLEVYRRNQSDKA
jgi:type III pantothenate kinase